AASALAVLAGIVDDLAAARAGRAGALDREETLVGAHAAMAAASRALPGLRAGLGASAGAGFASDRGRHMDGGILAGEGLFQPDLEVVAQIGATLAAIGAARASAPGVAEEGIEDVRHEVGEIAPAGLPAAAIFEGGMAEAVIGRALLAVREDLIGLVEFLELDLGGLVAG